MNASQGAKIRKKPEVGQTANLLSQRIGGHCHGIRFLRGVFLIGLLSIGGCGADKPPFQEVVGRVTFHNVPLRKGLIEFVPTVTGGTRAGATVRDGQYTVRREAGLLPGTYRVTVVPKVPMRADWDEDPAAQTGREITPTQNIKIPEKYNVATILTAEVTAEDKQTIDFDLE